MFGAKRTTTLCALAALMLVVVATTLTPSVAAKMMLAAEDSYGTPPPALVAFSDAVERLSPHTTRNVQPPTPTPATEAPRDAVVLPPEDSGTAAPDPDRAPSSRGARKQADDEPAPPAGPPAPETPGPAAARGVASIPEAQVLEARLLGLLNQERARHGLETLETDATLVELARQRSADMATRSYFGHVSPEGKMVFEAMDAAGIEYQLGGENLARNTYPPEESPDVAHEGFMNSPTHRENELEPRFDRVGIGVAIGSSSTIYFTELFIDTK